MEEKFTKNDLEKKFDSFKNCPSKDIEKVIKNRESIEKMAKKGPLKKFIDDIRTFFEMVGDYFTGKYREVPFGTITGIIGTLLYVLSPIDFIPDFIPGIGLLDDAAMVAFCLSCVGSDVDKYRSFKEEA